MPKAPTRRQSLLAAVAAAAVVLAVVLLSVGAHAVPTRAATPQRACPAGSEGYSHAKATRPAALKVLVPKGADSLLVCRYGLIGGSKPAGPGLTGAGLTRSAEQIAKITDGLDAIRAGRHLICPDFEVLGGETLTFAYHSGPSVILTINLGGCLDISNGHVTRAGLDAPVFSEIEALLRPLKSAAP
jgi:hypothetical protein